MADSGQTFFVPAKTKRLSLLETMAAKEAKSKSDCLGKPLGCSYEILLGL